jgi:hypothetical protein
MTVLLKTFADNTEELAVDAVPNSAPAWHALSVTDTMAHRYGDGAEAVKHAIQLNPN